jgi:hypothetical protein
MSYNSQAAPAPSTDAPVARIRGGGYWLAATGIVLGLSLVLTVIAAALPQIPDCGGVSHNALRLLDAAILVTIPAAASALVGVCFARGWRVWFLLLLLGVPVLAIASVSQSLSQAPHCPGLLN